MPCAGGVQRWQGAPGSQMPAPRFPGSQMIPLGERGEGPHSGPGSPGFPSSPSLGRPPRPMSSPSMPAGSHLCTSLLRSPLGALSHNLNASSLLMHPAQTAYSYGRLLPLASALGSASLS